VPADGFGSDMGQWGQRTLTPSPCSPADSVLATGDSAFDKTDDSNWVVTVEGDVYVQPQYGVGALLQKATDAAISRPQKAANTRAIGE